MIDPGHATNQPAALSLTAAQQSAIAHRQGEMVVLAGAGSGKTATLARRCAQLVTATPDACDVRELLVLTFTREAADEMRSRIALVLRQAADNQTAPELFQHLHQQAASVDTAQINTFHGFCNWAAKTWFMFCRVDPGFTLLNEHESAMLQTDALHETARQFMAETHPRHPDFVEIFDLYAGASPAKLELLVMPILQVMQTVVDPDAWCNHASNSGATEIQAVLTTFIQQKARRLEELAIMLAASADDAELLQADAKKLMFSGLSEAAVAAKRAAEALTTAGPAEWTRARNYLISVKFAAQIRLRDSQDKPQTEHFRDGTYKPLKEAFIQLCDEFAGSDIAHLQSLETTGRRRIGTFLAFAQAAQRQYQQVKQWRRQLDYSDLERTLIAALSEPGNPLQTLLHQRFRHILVDEYQDINPVQQRLIELLYRGDKGANQLKPGSLFGVGDVLQSIYGFRGSEPQILHNMATQLRLAGQGNKIVTMRENYRTLPPLVDTLNAIIKPMLNQVQLDSPTSVINMAELADLYHGRPPAPPGCFPGIPVELHVLTTSREDSHANADVGEDDSQADSTDSDPFNEMQADELEATRIGQLITELLQSSRKIGNELRPLELKDIAILLRAPSRRAPHYVRTLGAMGILANASLTTGFFESSEVLEVLDILRVLDNPKQDIALVSVLIGPIGGCTMAELAYIRRNVTSHVPFHQAVIDFVRATPTDAAASALAEKIKHTLTRLEQWRSVIRTETLVNALSRIMQEAGLLNQAAAMIGGRQRLANLRLLQQRAMEFSGFELQSLSRFVNFFERLREERDLGEAAPPAGNTVRIMSIHGSKGLEFPVVFVAGLGTAFNKRDLQQQLLVDRDKGIGIKVLDANGVLVQDSPGRRLLAEEKLGKLLQEEARLLYVAMTRARDQLILIGRMAESTVEKWSKISLPGIAGQYERIPALKSPSCPLAWLGPIFSQYSNLQRSGETGPLLTLHIIPESSLFSADNQQTNSLAPTVAVGDVADDGVAHADTVNPNSQALKAVFNRITQPYAHEDLTRLAAVASVSRLKAMRNSDIDSPAIIIDAPPNAHLELTTDNSGIQRGLLMHRVLQRLDYQRTSEDTLGDALADLVRQGHLTPEELAQVDQPALLWLFSTPLGNRMRQAAIQSSPSHQLLRELNFLWSLPARQAVGINPATPPSLSVDTILDPGTTKPHTSDIDIMLIRGTIDGLLIEPDSLEIIDYKTDAAAFIPSRLPAYQQQVRYYASAAAEILKKPVHQTSLIFFSTRRIISRSLSQ